MDKKSFILHLDLGNVIELMDNEQAGQLIKAVFHWHKHEIIPNDIDNSIKFILISLVSQFKRDASKWEKIRAKRSEAGKCGAKQKLANAGKRKHKLANQAVSVSGSVSVSVSDSELIPPNPQGGTEVGYQEAFLAFWEAYPRKVGKGAAYRSWQKAKGKPDKYTMAKIIAEHSKSDQWKKDGGQFIPHPATWINQRRWEDTVENNGYDTLFTE